MPLDTSEGQMLLTREKAAACGLSRFWTGRPCKAGHFAERYVCNLQCVQCNADRARLKRASDPSYRMFRSVQRRSGQVLKGRASPSLAVGCNHAELRSHMAHQFTEGMIWKRYGQWEVDHIIPLSAAGSLEDLMELCHFQNLQPLWKRDNLLKGGA